MPYNTPECVVGRFWERYISILPPIENAFSLVCVSISVIMRQTLSEYRISVESVYSE